MNQSTKLAVAAMVFGLAALTIGSTTKVQPLFSLPTLHVHFVVEVTL